MLLSFSNPGSRNGGRTYPYVPFLETDRQIDNAYEVKEYLLPAAYSKFSVIE